MGEGLTRRELALRAAGGALATVVPLAPLTSESNRGRVGVARLTPPTGGGALPAAQARQAIEQALVAATGAGSGAAAARALFRPEDTVGIKLNCLGGPRLSPRPALVEALANVLAEVGIPPVRIIAFERSSRELSRAGFAIRRSGGSYSCYGIDNDFDRQPETSGQIGSCFARLVSTTCTALVSFGVVKDHDLAGVSAGLKNLYGIIHNPNKYHDHNCDPYVADVLRHRFVSGKLRLTVLDGVTAQCHGGPGFRPDMVWPLGVVVASTDPVATDAWAWQVIDEQRRRRGLPTLEATNRPPRFLATAARYGLGIGDPAAIKVVTA
jgi:uncharacterized protein (DUF362 family)